MDRRSFLIAGALVPVAASAVRTGDISDPTRTSNVASHTFVVSPSGNDSGAGTINAPFQTLERARTAVRQVLRKRDGKPITVYLRGGSYRVSQSFALTAQDSGTARNPVTWCAFPGEAPIITGGIALSASDFAPVADAGILARLKPAVQGQVLEVDLAALGVTLSGSDIQQTGFNLPAVPPPPELFVDNVAQTIARYPNDGTVSVGTVLSQTNPAPNVVHDDSDGDPTLTAAAVATPVTFTYTDPELTNWATYDNVWMQGQFYYSWADGNVEISSVDVANQTITTVSDSYYGFLEGQPYYYYNVLEELDTPGEYYLDTATAKLYFLPGDDFDGATLSILDAPIMTISGAAHITFSGFSVQDGRGDGIVILNGQYLRFDKISMSQLGGTGFVFGLRVGDRSDITRSNEGIEGGSHNVVTRATIAGTGREGVFLGGGDRQALLPGANEVSNCDISEMGRLQQAGSPAVEMAGVGNVVTHNSLHDGPNDAILLHGNNHSISHNVIANVMQETGDGGAIYIGRDFTEAGNIVEYNYIHDVNNTVASGPKVGVYMDDQASGVTVRRNVINNADYGVLVGGGRENVIDQNVFAGSGEEWAEVDSRGFSSGWTDPPTPGSNAEQMTTELAAVPYQDATWAREYPWLPGVLSDNPEAPINTRLTRNVIGSTAGAPSIDSVAAGYITQTDNITATSSDLRTLIRLNAAWAQGVIRTSGPVSNG